MLAIVKSAASMRSPLLYNTEKVEQKQAFFLEAHNFLLEKEELTMQKELETFQRLTQLNERSKQKAIHISLNFAESDHLNDRQLIRVAGDFMRGIGFGDQPWLLYQHVDAGHPHLHVVTTNIRPDGSRISNDLRSPRHLKQICYQLEEKHHLTPAIPMPDLFGPDKPPTQQQDPRYLQKATYGQSSTKKQIETILRTVNESFSFSSLEAYNAVLCLYGVRADRGREDSNMYRSRGLYYRMIDAAGRKIGAPIKASAFNEPVTLEKLEQKFMLSQERIPEADRHLRVAIDYNLAGNPKDYSWRQFADELRGEQIWMVIPALIQRPRRQPKPVAPSNTKPDDGHSIFYVDFHYKTVTRDTDLGLRYTAASLLQRTGVERELRLLHDQGKLQFSKRSDQEALQPDYPDPAETRRILFKLSPQYSEIVQKKLEHRQRQEQKLRQTHRMRHSL
jgi:Relaxase/Mobilisation nuclease domain